MRNTIHPSPTLVDGGLSVVTSEPTMTMRSGLESTGVEGLEAVGGSSQVELLGRGTSWEILCGGVLTLTAEERTAIPQTFCGGATPFDVRLLHRPSLARYTKEILTVKGNPSYCGCGADATIEAASGEIVGSVEQLSDCAAPAPHFALLAPDKLKILSLVGGGSSNWLPCLVTPAPAFHVFLPGEKDPVGRIVRERSNPHWTLNFPLHLPLRAKTLLLASTFLLEFQYFEDNDES